MAIQEQAKQETEIVQNRGRKPKASRRSSALTIKMQPEALAKIEKTVEEIQSLANTRKPDKADVLLWMLSKVKPQDLKHKIDQWNELFE